MSSDQTPISDPIRRALKDSGLSQAAIAQAAGISQRAVSEFLSGKAARSTSLDRLAECLGVSLKIPKKSLLNIRKRIAQA